ncbi:Scr1 family TA system antitoxin-like transcriptional regulator [Streptomyces sp. NPDC002773]|uniref:Scr1 family TA system antitoxin-like transcriptional regulator n=1 Tax=Streptomyces sp. NPDC002773 TaxID=3154430 RepID=UPI003320AB86
MAYARAEISAISMTAPPEVVAPLVEVRMARQSVLTRPSPPKLRAIIHETALTTRAPGLEVSVDHFPCVDVDEGVGDAPGQQQHLAGR